MAKPDPNEEEEPEEPTLTLSCASPFCGMKRFAKQGDAEAPRELDELDDNDDEKDSSG